MWIKSVLVAAAVTAVVVPLIGRSSSAPVPMPRPRPVILAEAAIMPADPAVVTRHEPPELYGVPEPSRVRSIPITKEEHEWRPTPPKALAGPVLSLPPPKRPLTVARTAHDDICARHRLRKVYTSKYSWRCRR